MAERKPARRGRASQTWTAEERAAMREVARERKSQTGEADVLAKIAEMPDEDRAKAERFHGCDAPRPQDFPVLSMTERCGALAGPGRFQGARFVQGSGPRWRSQIAESGPRVAGESR